MVAAPDRPRLPACVDALAAARRTAIGPASARPAAPPLEEVGAPREERRVVSVLFVDLVGFTSRSERLDPEDVRAMLSRYYERARAEIERFGGTVEKFIGDAVMAVFGAPVAYGDDPERAVRAALAVRDAIAEMDFDDPLLELQTRAAVNTGEAVVELTRQQGAGVAMVAGDVVNTASRLQSNAPVDSVVVGEETLRGDADGDRVRAARGHGREGQGRPGAAWVAIRPLVAAGERRSRRSRSWGGARSSRRSGARGTWCPPNAARRSSRCSAPRGSGSLGSPTSSRTASRPPAASPCAAGRPATATPVRTARSPSTSRSSRAFTTATTPDDALAKLRARAAELEVSEDPDEVAEHLAILSGLPVEGSVADRETLFFSARLFLEAVARERPDPARVRGPAFRRPEPDGSGRVPRLARPGRAAAARRDRPPGAAHRPSVVGRRAAGVEHRVARRRSASTTRSSSPTGCSPSAGSSELADRAGPLAATSDGNPLFIEELTASLAERSTRDPGRLPSSIRSIVAARLDSLPGPERDAIFDAAVVGKVFWRGALERLRPDGPDLSPILGSLERRDLIRREASSRIKGEQQYAFKHGLIREVAYLTLPREERRRCHRATAEYLEEVTLRAGDADATLAHHWREAGETRARAPSTSSRPPSSRVAAGRRRGPSRSTGRPWSWSPRTPPELKKEIVRKRALAAVGLDHEFLDMGRAGAPGARRARLGVGRERGEVGRRHVAGHLVDAVHACVAPASRRAGGSPPGPAPRRGRTSARARRPPRRRGCGSRRRCRTPPR